jgi:signal transduction protein with GAF and PtsI domain
LNPVYNRTQQYRERQPSLDRKYYDEKIAELEDLARRLLSEIRRLREDLN